MGRSDFSVRGFSLIELTFVLVLIGIFVVAGYSMLRNAVTFSAERDTEKVLNELILEFKSTAASSGRLPENTPVSVKDGYGRELNINLAATLDICIQPRESLSLTLCRNADCSAKDEFSDVAAVFYGAGNDGALQVHRTGRDFILPFGKNDDPIRWLSYGELASDAACGSFRIITNHVPAVYSSSRYEAEFYSVPAADSWCIETDSDTAEILGIKGVCEEEGDFTEASAYRFKTDTAAFTEAGTKLITVHAKRGGATVSAKFAVPFYPERIHAESGSETCVLTSELVKTTSSSGSSGVDIYIEPKEILSSFTIKNNSGTGSACLWVDKTFNMKKVFRMYYEVETGYKDNNAYSIGSTFGGHGLVIYPVSAVTGYPQCGMNGTAWLGYGGLSFGGLGLVMETDLYPDRNLDYKENTSKNHIAFIPCKNSSGDRCMGNHFDPAVPQCPDDSGCYEPESDGVNWLEDGKSHPVRVELHAGYGDAACKAKKPNGTYILAEAWVDCIDCREVSTDYGRRKPDITYCASAGEAGEMLSFSLGFTFGGEMGTDISFKSFSFNVE